MNLLSGVEQDFHRPQKTPGAYEWWHFDGTDDTSAYCFSAQFYAGHLLSPYYQESLAAYWRHTQSPLVSGQTPTPPNPLDYCGVVFRLFHKGSLAAEFLQEFDPGMLKASDQGPAVLLGSNRFNWLPEGNPASYSLTLQGVIKQGRESLRARVFFTPGNVPLPPARSSEALPTHTWILAAPRCHVEGTFEWCDREGNVKKEVPFVGQGYHDHHFGSVPLGRFVKAWHWGRAFLGNETLVYSFQIPVEENESSHGFLWTAGTSDDSASQVAFKPSQSRRNFFWLPYHKNLQFTDTGSLRIDHRQILSDGPVSLAFEDQVQWLKNGKTVEGPGLSNYLYTPRLSSRFFFPLLKGKTVRVAKAASILPDSINKPGGDVFTDRSDIPLK